MGKIPTLTTLRVEDFPSEVRQWIPRLFLPLNQFLTVVTNTLQGRVNFVTNIPAQDTALNFSYNGLPQTFSWGLATSPNILLVGQSLEEGQPITLIPQWSYDASRNLVSVDFFEAPTMEPLTVGYRYKIFVRTIP